MGFVLHPDHKVTQGKAIAILILNFIPGVGTMVYGRIGRGVVDLVLTVILIGWFMALADSIQILTKAVEKTPTGTTTTPTGAKG